MKVNKGEIQGLRQGDEKTLAKMKRKYLASRRKIVIQM